MIYTKAKTVAEVYDAFSAACFICLSCDEIEITEFSNFMIHSISFGAEGKSGEVVAQSSHVDKLTKKLISTVCHTFLTNDEISKVVDGKDFWFTSEEIKRKLKNWVPIRKR